MKELSYLSCKYYLRKICLKSFSSETQAVVCNILNEEIKSIKKKKNIQWKMYVYIYFSPLFIFLLEIEDFLLKKESNLRLISATAQIKCLSLQE